MLLAVSMMPAHDVLWAGGGWLGSAGSRLGLAGFIWRWFAWICLAFGLVSAGFRLLAFIYLDFGWILVRLDFALSFTFTRIFSSSRVSEALIAL